VPQDASRPELVIALKAARAEKPLIDRLRRGLPALA
jgi:hypothetical protein